MTFVDWGHATTGPACIDAASLASQLVLAGHAPADIARLLQDHSATADSPDTTTAFLAALTGHWHRSARQPAPPGAPGLRALATGLLDGASTSGPLRRRSPAFFLHPLCSINCFCS
ncbi:hypothetical protein O1M63_49675 [Streptomyces mirabilis]|nr:hypothetical protein [Streptomyces mirabilis]